MSSDRTPADDCPARATCGAERRLGPEVVPRREFLRVAAASAAVLATRPLISMAGPFECADFERLVPADKRLSERWVASLFERGEASVYRGVELAFIGMPVGGITTGRLYLGGDGKLWHWDIFNQTKPTFAGHYSSPLYPWASVDYLEFLLRVLGLAPELVRPLKADGFRDIPFRGEYPIGHVHYQDPACPIELALEAFSPFIPLNMDDSSLPVTLFRFTLTNKSAVFMEGELVGRLENAVGRSIDPYESVTRTNRIERDGPAIPRLRRDHLIGEAISRHG